MRYFSSARHWRNWTCLIGAIAVAGIAVAKPHDPESASGEPLQEVTVTAGRVLDHKALEHAVTNFVESHSTPNTRINQIGRWHENVCPMVTGLQPPARDFITREVLDTARAVGAPTRAAGKKCNVNVEIVFTREPQALVDHIAKSYRILMGYYPKAQVAQAMKFSRPIQAWYETATRSENFHPGSVEGQVTPAAQVDSDETAIGWQPNGSADSLLGNGRISEFVHIMIIADSSQVDRYPLRAVADYVSLLSLTRMAALDNCAPLESITDLLANGCSQPVATTLTTADRAYLTGLYGADLDKSLNLERGDVHERMMRQLEAK